MTSAGSILRAVCTGLAVLGADRLEPAAKAQAFRDALAERHVAAEGFVMYEVDLRRPFDSANQIALADTPTFTGLWAVSSCDRADVASGVAREQALADAEHALEGLAFLMAVTGQPGLLARGIQRGAIPDEPGRHWFRGAPGYESYAWLEDVSQDQYANGLLPALAECRAHFPQRVRSLAVESAELLLRTDMRLVDPDGRRTTYGDLSPRAGRGFNSIGKLTGYAIFALAADLDGDPRWREQRDRLRDRERVVATSERTSLKIPRILAPAPGRLSPAACTRG